MLPSKRDKVHVGGTSRRRYQRRYAKRVVHECDLCRGMHIEVRERHAYQLRKVRDSECKGVLSNHGFWFKELIDFERGIKESDAYWRRRQRNMSLKWHI